jgi:hypothetical protein
VDLAKAKKISRTAAAKSLFDLHATLSKTDQEMLAIESLLSLSSENILEYECPKTSPCSDNLTEPTANIEPLCPPESPK